MGSHRHDITGQRFGKQIVTREFWDGYVEIRCDCGTVKRSRKQYIVNGQSRSCGCGRYAQRETTGLVRVGDVFDRLTVVQVLGSNGHKREILCLCSCGKRKVVHDDDLRRGSTTSCGCFRRERMGALMRKHGDSGIVRSYLYRAWESMRVRCSRPDRYPSYAGRGIRVCDEWEASYEAFRSYVAANLGERPKGMSLDRIGNEGNYEPGNIRWAPPQVQTRNRSSNKFYTIDGVTMCLADWATKYNLRPGTICGRLRGGWDIRDAITIPLGRQRPR